MFGGAYLSEAYSSPTGRIVADIAGDYDDDNDRSKNSDGIDDDNYNSDDDDDYNDDDYDGVYHDDDDDDDDDDDNGYSHIHVCCPSNRCWRDLLQQINTP